PSLLFITIPRPPSSPLFPYTTLFRSCGVSASRRRPLIRRAARRRNRAEPCVQRRSGGARLERCDAVPDDVVPRALGDPGAEDHRDRKSTRLNSSHVAISYAVFCLKKK